MTTAPKPSPIEVWLSRKNIGITCMVVQEDESTQQLDVDSLSMRGAQREITGHLLREGYAPIGRWEVESYEEAADDPNLETVRRFKLAEGKG